MVTWLMAGLLLMYSGVSSASSEDPWKPLNTRIFNFNETADKWVAKPLAKGYERVLPGPVSNSVTRFFKNLTNVNNSVNNIFQFKLKAATTDLLRLAINSTVGIGGLFDPATPMGLPQSEEDWGQTLGVWKVGNGPYFMLPLLGPSTVRDTFGLLIDSFFTPTLFLDHVATRNSVWVLGKVDARANLLSAEGLIIGDKYLFYRGAYLQRRNYLVNDGKVEDQFGDDF
jgi:phospholipid-binding lipoprotein MlaA